MARGPAPRLGHPRALTAPVQNGFFVVAVASAAVVVLPLLLVLLPLLLLSPHSLLLLLCLGLLMQTVWLACSSGSGYSAVSAGITVACIPCGGRRAPVSRGWPRPESTSGAPAAVAGSPAVASAPPMPSVPWC